MKAHKIYHQIPTLDKIETDFPQMKILLFDMDGTLLDSEGQHAVALQQTFKVVGQGEILKLNSVEIKAKYIGQSDPKVYEDLVAKDWFNADVSLSSFLLMKKNFLMQHLKKLTPKELVHPSIQLLLDQIKKRGVKIGLVSASEGETVRAYLKQAGVLERFQIVLSRDDCERSKPDPMPYLMAMAHFNVGPQETVIMEDSKTGLTSALAAKANVIEARWFAED